MLTLITGTPGAGKTLLAVWDFARKVPGSTVESKGQAVPRRLYTNIKDLLVEHESIDADALRRWHEWAQPGDVILFDEVQEVWRPRSLGKEVPPEIQALETHRHKGVDIILVTQHPMLVDSNVRRLVNLHFHVRRLTKKRALVYEWDHCAQPGNVKTALQSRLWTHPKEAYGLYKSAQLHTKPVTRMPRIALLLIPVLGLLGFSGHFVYNRAQERLAVSAPKPQTPKVHSIDFATLTDEEKAGKKAAALAAPLPAAPLPVSFAPKFLGCIASVTSCRCYAEDGHLAEVTTEQCQAAAVSVLSIVQTGTGVGWSASTSTRGGIGGVAPDADAPVVIGDSVRGRDLQVPVVSFAP